MAEPIKSTPSLLTKTKTRTKVLLGVALAVIIGGIIVAAGIGPFSQTAKCKGGARHDKPCRTDKNCPAIATGMPAGKCAKLSNLPNLAVSIVNWNAEGAVGAPTFHVHNFGDVNSPAIPGPNGLRMTWLTATGEIATIGGTPQQFSISLPAITAGSTSPGIGWGFPPPLATHLRIELDLNNAVTESNENDNTRIEPIPSAPAPAGQ